jgi:predicted DNA-binding WGR domain protein
MNNLLTVAFEAHHAERNHHRRYTISVGRDLLDDWTVCVHYGRIGQRGQELCFANHEAEILRRIVRDRLRRRLSAPRRIGCSYRLKEFSSATGFNVGDWLPGEIIARFFVVSPA